MAARPPQAPPALTPSPRPAPTARSPRACEIVAAARSVVEAEGLEALTMRRIGEVLGMRAPSLYKHFADKAGVEAALIEEALFESGEALHVAVARPGRRRPVAALLAAYRRVGVDNPSLYRLATTGRLDRDALPVGLEGWTGEPFYLAMHGDEYRAQALWSFAHGMVILEIDGRYPEGSNLDRTWRAGADSFSPRL